MSDFLGLVFNCPLHFNAEVKVRHGNLRYWAQHNLRSLARFSTKLLSLNELVLSKSCTIEIGRGHKYDAHIKHKPRLEYKISYSTQKPLEAVS